MNTGQGAPATIDEYIAGFPTHVQAILQQIRMAIRAAVPEAVETISYQMPAFTLGGRSLVYFAAFKRHIGLYPAPTGVDEFAAELALYGAGKGTLKLPLDQPIPLELAAKLARYRAAELRSAAEANAAKRRALPR